MEQGTMDCSELTGLFEGCRETYASYSDAADQYGYYPELEPGIVQTIETLEYIRTQAGLLMVSMHQSEKTMGNGDYAVLRTLSDNCMDYVKKMASLRERHKSLFAAFDIKEVKKKINNLFGDLFSQSWFREYTNVTDIEALRGKGVTHGFFQKGKQEKFVKAYMLTLGELDTIIYGLLCVYTSDDSTFDTNTDIRIQTAIEEVIASMDEVKNDPRRLKAVYNKYSELLEYLLKKTGNYGRVWVG